ncbi:MAG: DUF167 domain-containing protein [Candidatus Omnitrophica bacterium]|nr:DUF167 domain-containing protein [Candidatus Omnitrophota bacterium]
MPTIQVKVKTKSSSNRVLKNADGTYTAYLTQPPVEGKANNLLVELLSKEFGVAKSFIRIIKGAHSKNKLIAIGE